MEIIAVGGYETVCISDISTGQLIATLVDHSLAVHCVCFSPSGRYLATGSRDNAIIIWECDSWSKLQTLLGHRSEVFSVAFNSSEDMLASSSDDKTVRVWHLFASIDNQLFERDCGFVCPNAVRFHANGSTIAVAGGLYISFYNFNSGELEKCFSRHEALVCAICFSVDSSILASGADDAMIYIWDTDTVTVLHALRGHSSTISHVAFNHDATRLASSSWDCTVRIWDVSTGACLRILAQTSHYYFSCCFSEFGNKVITCGELVKVWDSVTGEVLRTMADHRGYVSSVSYRSNGIGSYI